MIQQQGTIDESDREMVIEWYHRIRVQKKLSYMIISRAL